MTQPSGLARTLRLIFLALIVCFCCEAQDHDDLGKLVNSVSGWGTELNSPGTKLDAHLMTREVRKGANYGFYDFYLTGAPADQVYTIFQWPLGKPQPETVMPAYISDNGRLCMHAIGCHDTSGPYVMLAFLSFPGLPHRIGIASGDKKYKAALTIIPDPIVAEDRGCHVEVIRAREDFSLAVLRGRGFQPKDEIHYTSNSAGEKMKGSFKANEFGEFVTGFGPGVKGKSKGDDTINFKALGCAPSVSYHWGALGN